MHPEQDTLCDQKYAAAGYSNRISGVGEQLAQDCAGRQSAKGVLRDRIHNLRREADRLEALAGALPEKLPPFADEALWDLIVRR